MVTIRVMETVLFHAWTKSVITIQVFVHSVVKMDFPVINVARTMPIVFHARLTMFAPIVKAVIQVISVA